MTPTPEQVSIIEQVCQTQQSQSRFLDSSATTLEEKTGYILRIVVEGRHAVFAQMYMIDLTNLVRTVVRIYVEEWQALQPKSSDRRVWKNRKITPEEQFESAVEHNGWNPDSQVLILLRYIRLSGNPDSFEKFLIEQAKDEVWDGAEKI